MAVTLPILPTMGVGSYAAPGWFIAGQKAARDGAFGPHDLEEMLTDATRIAVLDQQEAGVDILTDGELRRQRFVYEMYGRIEGIERVAPRRRLGIPGYDMAPSFKAVDALAAPGGFGLVEDFETLNALAPDAPKKVALPGPMTFAMNIQPRGGKLDALLDEIVALIQAEVTALAAAGCDHVQFDEPAFSREPHGMSHDEGALLINRAMDGVDVRKTVHVCFGNNAGRPFADRRFAPLAGAMEALSCDALMLEFANREMAELELMTHLSQRFDIAAGVVDVKNWKLESGEDVARRIRQCLEYVPAERLQITADCGFSALPRYLAKAKMTAMVEGARIVRGEV